MDKDKRKLLAVLTWPLFIELFLRLLMGNVNVFMLSHYSDNAVGAVGVSTQIINMLLVLYSVVGTGTAIIISQYIGAGMKGNASRVANVAIVANFGFGLILSLVVAVFAKALVRFMNVPDEMTNYAYQYTLIVGAASFTQALIATMSAIARSYGYTKFPMYVAFGMNIINIIGNYAVIFKPFGLPSYGVPGVAFSVVVSEAIGAVAMGFILYKRLGIRIHISDFRPFPRDILKSILSTGTPAAGEYASYTFTQLATTYIVSFLGSSAINTKVYVQNITFFVFVLGLSIGQGTQILTGQLVGAGKTSDAYKTCLWGLKIALISNFIMSLICIAFRRQLLGIFTENPGIIEMGSVILLVDFAVEMGRAINNVVTNALRGAGDVKYPAVIDILSMWGVSVNLCYILGIVFKMGLVGIWIAFAADEWCRGMILLKRWVSKKWKTMAMIEAEDSRQTFCSPAL